MKKYIPLISFTSLALILCIPLITRAAEFAGIKGLIQGVGGIVKNLIVVVAGVALLGFFYGLTKFIFHAGDKESLEEGKNIMIWGIIALFVMMSVWGIIGFFQSAFGLPVTIPPSSVSGTSNPPDGGGLNCSNFPDPNNPLPPCDN